MRRKRRIMIDDHMYTLVYDTRTEADAKRYKHSKLHEWKDIQIMSYVAPSGKIRYHAWAYGRTK